MWYQCRCPLSLLTHIIDLKLSLLKITFMSGLTWTSSSYNPSLSLHSKFFILLLLNLIPFNFQRVCLQASHLASTPVRRLINVRTVQTRYKVIIQQYKLKVTWTIYIKKFKQLYRGGSKVKLVKLLL